METVCPTTLSPIPRTILRGKNGAGFTLIELLISISIIAILISIAVVQYSSVNQRSRDGKRKSDLEQIRAALEIYRDDKGYYPPFSKANPPSGGWFSCMDSDTYTQFKDVVTPTYISEIPQDPKETKIGTVPCYLYNSDGSTYLISATLENTADPDIYTNNPSSCGLAREPSYVDQGYNYCVINP